MKNNFLHLTPDTINSIQELEEVLQTLPKLRTIQPYTQEHVIVCDETDIQEAINFYSQTTTRANIYALGITTTYVKKGIKISPISELSENVVHVFFKPSLRPIDTHYTKITSKLASMGIYQFSVEEYSASKFYRKPKLQLDTEQKENFILIYNTLNDKESKYTYISHYKMRTLQDPSYLLLADYPQYWHPLVSVKENDIVCEGGPEFGDTTADFASTVGNKGKIYAFEPDLQNLHKSKEFCKNFSNIEFINKGLYSHDDTYFINSKFFNKVIKERVDESDFECVVTSIDSYFKNKPLDFIKFDIEGAELKALEGANVSLKQQCPKLAIAIYHNMTDFIDVPLWLHSLKKQYKFYIGHHTAWYAETVIYGKPK